MPELVRQPEEIALRPEKAPEAFRTISEVAESLHMPQHVLRFWESRFSQIRPMKRGGGRRLYRPQDVDLLRGIRHLLYGQGYTIRGVQRILKEQGTAHVVAVGKGAVQAAEPRLDPTEPKSVALAPRRPRIIARSDDEAAQVLTGIQAPTRLGMTKEQVTGLREALADLLWARRILSGSGSSR
jgi:DNA-binding transcriptional MerR regulator